MANLVSVIVNCLNSENTILRAVRSVINQTYTNLELIVWDNASSDNTYDIVDYLDDDRVRLHRSSQTTSLGVARNKAIKLANGKYIAFCDADDWWHPLKLETQLKVLEESNYSFVCSDFNVVNLINNTIKRKYEGRCSAVLTTSDLLKNYNVGLLTLVARTEIVKKIIEVSSPEFRYIWDFDVAIKMSHYADGFFTSNIVAYNTVNTSCLSVKDKNKMRQELCSWFKDNDKNIRALQGITEFFNFRMIRCFGLNNNIGWYDKLRSLLYVLSGKIYVLTKTKIVAIKKIIKGIRDKICGYSDRYNYIYFVNDTMTLPRCFSLEAPMDIQIKKIDKLEFLSNSKYLEYFRLSTIFNEKEVHQYNNYAVYVAEHTKYGIIHEVIVHLDAKVSPLKKTILPSHMITGNVAYLSTGYTIESYRRHPITLIVLGYLLKDLSNEHKINKTINLVHPTTRNGVKYFKSLGFDMLDFKVNNSYRKLASLINNEYCHK